jgi:hypothetical protein
MLLNNYTSSKLACGVSVQRIDTPNLHKLNWAPVSVQFYFPPLQEDTAAIPLQELRVEQWTK